MTSVNYRAKVEYEGSRYLGWQRLGKQDAEKTIQGKLEKILSKLYDIPIEKIQVIASGRTDAGVHAREQVINVHLPEGKSPKEIEEYCNHYLPEDIRIFSTEVVDKRFHSRFHAMQKEYHYRIAFEKPSVFERNLVWYKETKLNLLAMQKASTLLIGEHDFLGFSSLKKTKKSTVRILQKIDISEKNGEILFRFLGNGFLQNMVRILVGTLVEIGEGKRKIETISQIFQNQSREEAGFLAPAKGLILYKVYYDDTKEEKV